jgi:hypothetical protein
VELGSPPQSLPRRRLHHYGCNAKTNGSPANYGKKRDPHGAIPRFRDNWFAKIVIDQGINSDAGIWFLELGSFLPVKSHPARCFMGKSRSFDLRRPMRNYRRGFCPPRLT